MEYTFDAIIVGSGQAGPPLAGRLTQAGWKVALIEKDRLGGTCVNVGCTPTKAMVASAKVAYLAAKAAEYGLTGGDQVQTDIAKVQSRKNAIVANSQNGLESWIGAMAGCTLFKGFRKLETPTQVRVGQDCLRAKHIFLNVGTRPRVPDLPGIENVPYLTSTSLLDLKELPSHLVIVGGSYVGLEFAQMFRRFGSRVTVIERNATLLAHEDSDVCQSIHDALSSEGIEFRLGAECIQLEKRHNTVAVHLSCEDGPPEVEGSHILLAVGRTPNTDDLGLESVGISRNALGFIEVNEHLQTSVGNLWALGDCNGKGAFTHTAYNDFEIVAANLLNRQDRRVTDRLPAHALYIDPPLAHVGMSEREVLLSGRPALIGVRAMSKVGRAIEKGETLGMIKVFVDKSSDQILGATVFGVGGDEAIHCILTAMYARQPAALMRRLVNIHPTVSELIPTVFQDLRPLLPQEA